MLSHRSSRIFSRELLFAVAGALCASSASAAAATIPHGTIELIAENQWIQTGTMASLGLRFQLEKGWHIYWLNPGDSGEPPRVKWQLPKGVTAEDIEWPAPQRLGTSSVVDFGYADGVTLIVPVRVDANLATQQPAQIAADLSVLVCREMCIPGKARLSLSLPIKSASPAPDPHTAELFAAARKSLPHPAPANWKFNVADTNDSFVLSGNVGHQLPQAVFYPLAESQIDNAAPQKVQPTASGFRLTLRKSGQLLRPIDRLKGVLELSPDTAYLIDVQISKGTAANSNDFGIHSERPSIKGEGK